MLNQSSRRRYVLWIVLSTAALIFITRMVALTHNRVLHPDEGVFYTSVNSLLNAILHPGMEFVENKEYPEGTYYFQLVFQFAGRVFRKLFGIGGTKGLQHCGRFASVVYFTLGVCLGMRLLWRYLRKNVSSLVFYGITMCFSLFFIEQSRYGTGDMVSLFLLLLLLNITARAMETEPKLRWWLAAFFICGVLGAVKYPLVFFALIPLGAVLSQSGLKKPGRLVLFLLAVGAGFFLFSPKTMFDPGYVLRVIDRESSAYAFNTHESGGFANHLLNLTLYMLLYSDFPLLPPVVLAGFAGCGLGFLKNRGTPQAPQGTALLFEVIVPVTGLLFFVYNLFVPVLFFRTMTPLFAILTLYTAVAVDRLFARGKWGRLLVTLLTLCLVLRGGALVWIMSDDTKASNRMSGMISAAVDENWKETWYTCLFSFAVEAEQDVTEYSYHFMNPLIGHNNGMEIQPGQLIITGAQEFYLGQPYLLPVSDAAGEPIPLWTAFKEANQDYLLGQVYPDYYYYLFGGWIRGGTLSQYEFPCHYIYYRSE